MGDAQEGWGAREPLPGGADGVDLVAVLGGVRIVDDEELGAEALGDGLGLALPLAVDVENAEAVREARGDFPVEKFAPAGFGDAVAWLVGEAETEVELGVDPTLGDARVGGVAGEGG